MLALQNLEIDNKDTSYEMLYICCCLLAPSHGHCSKPAYIL